MSTITLKDIPPGVHRTLKSRAEAHGRSLNREIIAILVGTVRGNRIDGAAVRTHARAVREEMGVYLTERDVAVLKGNGRK